jgi:hypothetical protein
MSKDTFGPAFPVTIDFIDKVGCIVSQGDAGITKRDYFAAKAMIALIPMLTSENSSSEHSLFEYECISNEAYTLADAMLKVRSDL